MRGGQLDRGADLQGELLIDTDPGAPTLKSTTVTGWLPGTVSVPWQTDQRARQLADEAFLDHFGDEDVQVGIRLEGHLQNRPAETKHGGGAEHPAEPDLAFGDGRERLVGARRGGHDQAAILVRHPDDPTQVTLAGLLGSDLDPAARALRNVGIVAAAGPSAGPPDRRSTASSMTSRDPPAPLRPCSTALFHQALQAALRLDHMPLGQQQLALRVIDGERQRLADGHPALVHQLLKSDIGNPPRDLRHETLYRRASRNARGYFDEKCAPQHTCPAARVLKARTPGRSSRSAFPTPHSRKASAELPGRKSGR